MRRTLFLSGLVATMPMAASAAPVPAPVAELMRVAVESGDAATITAVVKTARKANPKSAAEIDALYAKLKYRAEFRQHFKLKRQKPLQGWKGKGEFGASSSTGSVNSAGVTLGLSLVRDGLRWKQAFTGAVDYLHHDGVEEKDRYFVGHQANYKFGDRLYALGLVSWEGNRAQGFKSRFIASLGAGFSVIQNPRMGLSLEVSPAVRETEYLGATGPGGTFAARVATSYHWSVTPKLTVTEDATVFRESQDETVTSESAITMKLIDALSARFSYRLQRESQTMPLLVRSTDTTSRVALVYTF
jgi:putative salt-induced outer membrane protein